jgi:hypothetical protein
MKEVCFAFNITKENCTKYVQFGNTFNLLHAATSFILEHQNSIGVACVSDKYGKRSWARYPALWTLKHVDSLPNPNPSDIEALDLKPISTKDAKVDEAAEAKRPEARRQAQEWAGIAQNPKSDWFVFVGRWSKQKGVDLIADIMPAMWVFPLSFIHVERFPLPFPTLSIRADSFPGSRSTHRSSSLLSDPSLIFTESFPRRSWLASWNCSRITSSPSPSSLLFLRACSVEPTLH